MVNKDKCLKRNKFSEREIANTMLKLSGDRGPSLLLKVEIHLLRSQSRWRLSITKGEIEPANLHQIKDLKHLAMESMVSSVKLLNQIAAAMMIVSQLEIYQKFHSKMNGLMNPVMALNNNCNK